MILGASGCGYRLLGRGGPLSEQGIGSVGVPVFGNRTPVPEIEQRFTEQVISELITRAKVEVRGDDRGVDALLEGEILTYIVQPVTVNEEGRATRYEVTVRARVALQDLRADRLLWEDQHFVFKSQYDVPEEEEEYVELQIVAIEQTARGFARTVVSTLMEGF
jgi:predicted GNAT family acetyltransferase